MRKQKRNNHKSTKHSSRSKNNYRSSFDKYVDKLHLKNIEKLKNLNRYPYENTDGEESIKRSLIRNKIRYVREYIVGNLKGDTKSYRAVDFYLPKYDVYLEFLGNWNTNSGHKERYKEKMRIYAKNNIKAIYIYPNQLYNISWVLKKELEKLQAIQEVTKKIDITKKVSTAIQKYNKDFEIKRAIKNIDSSSKNKTKYVNNFFNKDKVEKISVEWQKAIDEERKIREKIESIISIIYKLAKGVSILGLGLLGVAVVVGFFNQGIASNFLNFYWVLGIGLTLFILGFIFQIFYVVIEGIFVWFRDLVSSIRGVFK